MSDDHDRRSIVEWLLGIGAFGSLLSFLYPVLRFVIPPSVAEAIELNVVAATVAEMPPNSSKIFKFGRRPALLINTPSGELRAFDGICTHLNCTVQYRKDLAHIWCACHNGLYDLTGKNVDGPPPRPLPPLTVDVRGDEIVVSRSGS